MPAPPNQLVGSRLAPGGIPSGEVTSWREGGQENPARFSFVTICRFCNRGAPLILIPLDGTAQRAPSAATPRGWSCCHGETCLQGRQWRHLGTGCHSTSPDRRLELRLSSSTPGPWLGLRLNITGKACAVLSPVPRFQECFGSQCGYLRLLP